MHSSAMRRKAAASSPSRGRRMLAVFAGLVVLGGTIAFTQFASAADDPNCADPAAAAASGLRGGGGFNGFNNQQNGFNNQQGGQNGFNQQGGQNGFNQQGGQQQGQEQAGEDAGQQQGQEQGGQNGGQEQAGEAGQEQQGQEQAGEAGQEQQGQEDGAGEEAAAEECEDGAGAEEEAELAINNGLDVLGQSCGGSGLEPHTGFQEGERCVSTAMGEVGAAGQNPSLLISQSPFNVRVDQPFELRISTRNLVRDRFLGAAAGGYYLESSFLTAGGIQRGHFHVACRMLDSVREAPNPEPVPAFFRAVEDGAGGAQPDEVVVEVPGLPQEGIAQCAAWAGDGSHRAPMMERANQTPAFDAVRIRVR